VESVTAAILTKCQLSQQRCSAFIAPAQCDNLLALFSFVLNSYGFVVPVESRIDTTKDNRHLFL